MGDLIKAVPNDLVIPSFISTTGPTGFETVDNDSVSLPFLRLAQVNTPQTQGPDKIKGLEPGMYFSPSTGRVYGNEPSFVICGFFRTFTQWEGDPPASKFIASMPVAEFEATWRAKVTNQMGKLLHGAFRFVDTRNFFLLSAEHPEDGILLYAMSSTGIPASKKWLAKASTIKRPGPNGFTPAPMWSRVWTLKVNFVQSPKGSYYQMSDAIDMGWVDEKLAKMAEAAFHEAQAYDKARVSGVEKTDEPDWVKE